MRDTASSRHCKHIHTAGNQRRWWMMCYLVISRKLRRVERSSRRLICLWHWLQKKSSASSLRKLWKQSGREAGALERGNREEKEEEEEEEVVSDGEERGVHSGGIRHLWGGRRFSVTSTGEFDRVKCEGYRETETWTDCAAVIQDRVRKQNISKIKNELFSLHSLRPNTVVDLTFPMNTYRMVSVTLLTSKCNRQFISLSALSNHLYRPFRESQVWVMQQPGTCSPLRRQKGRVSGQTDGHMHPSHWAIFSRRREGTLC